GPALPGLWRPQDLSQLPPPARELPRLRAATRSWRAGFFHRRLHDQPDCGGNAGFFRWNCGPASDLAGRPLGRTDVWSWRAHGSGANRLLSVLAAAVAGDGPDLQAVGAG